MTVVHKLLSRPYVPKCNPNALKHIDTALPDLMCSPPLIACQMSIVVFLILIVISLGYTLK